MFFEVVHVHVPHEHVNVVACTYTCTYLDRKSYIILWNELTMRFSLLY